jgi:hypothetical protein
MVGNSGTRPEGSQATSVEVLASLAKESNMGEHEVSRVANAAMQVGFRRASTGEKMVTVDIKNAGTAATEGGLEEWNAELALEANEPETGRSAIGGEA